MGQNLAIQDTPDNHSGINQTEETGYETLAAKAQDGNWNLSILVQGVTCALCIQKIESALNARQEVKTARLNFSAKRLYIEWEGDAASANDFIKIVENLGYGVQPYDEKSLEEGTKSEERFLLLCLGVAGFAMGNVMLLSVGIWSTTAETMGMGTRELLHWISALIAMPTIAFSGRPFFRSALKVLRTGHTNMDVPISLALILASGASLFETINGGEHVYFDSAVMLTFFLLIGRYLDFKARDHARSSAHNLLQSFQGFATVLQNDQTKRVLIRDLKEGMMVKIAAGEKFPVDGIIKSGASTVDTSLVTGETLPREIKIGQEVFAGTMNIAAPVTLTVSKAADDSLLSDIVRLMDKAGQAQASYVRLADKAARLYTPVVHTMSGATFLGWIFLGGIIWQDALMIAITVLIITCPCALGLAVPVVQVLATSKLIKKGVFVKSGDALERLSAIDTAIFDKTGTLTEGELKLKNVPDKKAFQLAASLASHSLHPLSKALTKAYEGQLLQLDDIQEHEGQGLSAIYEGQTIKLGSRTWCGDKGAKPSGFVELWLNIDDSKYCCFYFEDTLRSDAKNVINHLKSANIKSFLVSGDRREVAERIGQEAGIEKIYAEQTPLQKYKILENLQKEEHKVLMVGDGLNDAPVLKSAYVSIAPGTAIDMAQNAADIIFTGDKLGPVYEIYKTARKTQNLVKQNFALAILYNIIAIPLAIMGYVTPFIAALAMSGSSLLVIANSFRLKLGT